MTRTAGALDAFFVRYERCVGPARSSLGHESLEGHGANQETAILVPEQAGSLVNGQKVPPAGRYYVSVKGKMELCGSFELTAAHMSAAELADYESPQSRRRWWLYEAPLISLPGGAGVVFAALALCCCVFVARLCYPAQKGWA